MIDMESFGEKLMMCRHHVDIAVVREFRVQPIARLARFSVTYAVGQDDVILCGIQELAGTKQHPAKLIRDELGTGAARSVEDQHGIINSAVGFPMWRAQRSVVQPQLRQSLAILKMKIPDC